MTSPTTIPIFVSFSGEGGVERMVSRLAHTFADMGHEVDLLLIKDRSAHLAGLPPSIHVQRIGSSHTWANILPLARYLHQHNPPAILVAKHRAIVAAVLARWLAGTRTRIVGRLGTHVTASQGRKGRLHAWLWHTPMRLFYPRVDLLIAVSEGVATDVRAIAGLPPEQVRIIRNPVIAAGLESLAAEACPHPWLEAGQPPVILAAGRFTPQKDFPTLIRAFAQVRQQRPCRLVILGKGDLQTRCLELARQLDVAENVSFPGFAPNPYPYMRRAAVFVLSSAWEGSPNVLTEAMALGTPVVSTDCPSGPSELLDNGRIAPLVPVGDADALATAIAHVLDNPPAADLLRQAVAEYNAPLSARCYLEALYPDNATSHG